MKHKFGEVNPTQNDISKTVAYVMENLTRIFNERNDVLPTLRNEDVLKLINEHISNTPSMKLARIDKVFNRTMHGLRKELATIGVPVIGSNNGSIASSFTILPKEGDVMDVNLSSKNDVYMPHPHCSNHAYVLVKKAEHLVDGESPYPLLDRDGVYTVAFTTLNALVHYCVLLDWKYETISKYKIIPIDMNWFMASKHKAVILPEMGYLLPINLMSFHKDDILSIDVTKEGHFKSVDNSHVVLTKKTFSNGNQKIISEMEAYEKEASEFIKQHLNENELTLSGSQYVLIPITRDEDKSEVMVVHHYPGSKRNEVPLTTTAFKALVANELLASVDNEQFTMPTNLYEAMEGVLDKANNIYTGDFLEEVNRLGIVRTSCFDGPRSITATELYTEMMGYINQCRGIVVCYNHNDPVYFRLHHAGVALRRPAELTIHFTRSAATGGINGGKRLTRLSDEEVMALGTHAGVCEYVSYSAGERGNSENWLAELVVGNTGASNHGLLTNQGECELSFLTPVVFGSAEEVFETKDGVRFGNHEKGVVVGQKTPLWTDIHNAVNRSELLTCHDTSELIRKCSIYRDNKGNHWVSQNGSRYGSFEELNDMINFEIQ